MFEVCFKILAMIRELVECIYEIMVKKSPKTDV